MVAFSLHSFLPKAPLLVDHQYHEQNLDVVRLSHSFCRNTKNWSLQEPAEGEGQIIFFVKIVENCEALYYKAHERPNKIENLKH